LKDEEAIDWRGRFRSFHWAYHRKGKFLRLRKGKRNRRNVFFLKGLVLMCGKVLLMREMCAKIKQGRISMTKPLEFYFK
jgi:hypothetical protein